MDHYINTAAADISRARTVGLAQLTPEPFPILVVGMKGTHKFFFANRGTIESWSGSAVYSLRLTIGDAKGELDERLGTFALTVGGGSAITVAADVDAPALERALNDDATMAAAGGVDVVEQGFGRFLLAMRAVGTGPALTCSAALSFPDCGATLNKLTAGDATTRELTMLTIRRTPALQTTTWVVTHSPSEGWTGVLDLTSSAAQELIRLKGRLRNGLLEAETVLTVEVIDDSGNASCYYQTPLTIRALNYDVVDTTMTTGPTRNAQANSSGDVTVAPASQIHTERITVTGAATTRNVSVTSPAGLVAGARIDLVFDFSGATNGTRIKIYALSTSGTLLFDFTRSGDEANAEFILYANGTGGFDRKEQTIPAFPNI